MSDESSTHQVNSDNENNDLEAKLAEQSEIIKNLQTQFEAVNAKKEELLNETKKAKAKAREEAEAAEAVKIAKAKETGEFEQLFKSSEEQRKALESQLQDFKNTTAKEKINNTAMKLATELADGYNAELLAEQIAKRLKFHDNKIQVTNESGDLTVSTLEALRSECANNERFKSLLRGNQATGGGAAGQGSGASKAQTISQQQFDSLNPIQKLEFAKKGGKIAE